MGKAVRQVRGENQKNIVRLIEGLEGKFSAWEIWQDFITLSAVSVANAIGGPYRDSREKMFTERIGKYSEKERTAFSLMFNELVEALERNPDQDFLGDMFMTLGCGDKWKGQFFTPYCVCRAMGAISYGVELKNRIEKRGWVTVGDCACGAGALLVAFANECWSKGINYQKHVLFIGQDLDFLASMMCYLQLSLLGCAGYVCVDDSIARPCLSYDDRGLIPVEGSRIWYTPMYHSDIWQWRRAACQMDLMIRNSKTAEPLVAPPAEPAQAPEPVTQETPATPSLAEVKAGQLTFF